MRFVLMFVIDACERLENVTLGTLSDVFWMFLQKRRTIKQLTF